MKKERETWILQDSGIIYEKCSAFSSDRYGYQNFDAPGKPYRAQSEKMQTGVKCIVRKESCVSSSPREYSATKCDSREALRRL